MIKQISLFVFSIIVLQLSAQKSTILIVDKEKNPLENAEVFISSLDFSSETNAKGIVKISLSKEKELEVNVLKSGFEHYNKNIVLIPNQEQIITIEDSYFNVNEIIYSTPISTLQDENVITIEVKKLKTEHRKGNQNLTEQLKSVPGVDALTTGNNIGKPVIRGLSGNRIVTMDNGIRVENQQWGNEHGLGVSSVGVSSIEVIKGPSSLLYGADALGGVLYINNERFNQHHEPKGFVNGAYNSVNGAYTTQVGVKTKIKNVQWNIFTANQGSHDYKMPKDVYAYNTRYNEQSVKTAFQYRNEKFQTVADYSYLLNNFGISTDEFPNSTIRSYTMENPSQKITNHLFTLKNKIFFNSGTLNVNLGYAINNREEFEDHNNKEHHDEEDYDDHDDEEDHEEEHKPLNMRLKTFTFNSYFKTKKINRSNFVIGVQGLLQENKNKGDEALIPDRNQNDFGIYTLWNYQADKLSVQAGVRVDFRKIDTKDFYEEEELHFERFSKKYNSINYSAGVSVPFNNFNLKAHLSSGFRAPHTIELLAHGSHHGIQQFLEGNLDLKNENTTQFDLELKYENKHFQMAVNPFYNHINNYIYLQPTDEYEEDTQVFAYQQIDAKLYGGEIGVHYHPHQVHPLHIQSNLSTVFTKDKSGNNLALIPQTRINTQFRLELEGLKKFGIQNLYIEHTYKFKQDKTAANETNSDAYQLFDLGLQYQYRKNFHIHTGISNVFNTSYIDHLSRLKNLNIQNPARSFFINATYKF